MVIHKKAERYAILAAIMDGSMSSPIALKDGIKRERLEGIFR